MLQWVEPELNNVFVQYWIISIKCLIFFVSKIPVDFAFGIVGEIAEGNFPLAFGGICLTEDGVVFCNEGGDDARPFETVVVWGGFGATVVGPFRGDPEQSKHHKNCLNFVFE